MARDVWYFSRDGEEKMGPASGDHLQQWLSTGQLTGETLVWRPGMDDWTPIRNVGEIQVAPPVQAIQPAAAAAGDSDTTRLVAILRQIKGAVSARSLLDMAGSKILWFGIVAPIVVIKTLVVPAIVSSAASTLAEGYGIELSVEDWSADLLDLSATAHDAVIQVPGPYAEAAFVSAGAIEVDLSLWSRIAHKKWVREIRIQEPKIYVERLLSGRWNYQDLMAAPLSPPAPSILEARSSSAGQEAEDTFVLTGLSIEDMGLQWVENLPGGSKGGMIQELKTTLFVDDISVSAKNLVGLVDLSSQLNSQLNLEARTGGGKISFTGRANLFSWAVSQERPDTLAWTPSMEGRIYVENVGTNVFARLMPDAAIVPEEGSMTGNIEFRLAERQVECHAHLDIRNATFTANQASRFVANDASAISAQLSGYQANGQYQFSCGGSLDEGTYRPFQAFQTNVVRQGVDRAPERVRVLAAVEHVRYSEDPIDPSLESEVNRILGSADPEWLQWAGLAVRLRESGFGRKFSDRFNL